MDNVQKRNILLMYHRHKLLDLNVSNKLFTNPISHQRRIKFAVWENIGEVSLHILTALKMLHTELAVVDDRQRVILQFGCRTGGLQPADVKNYYVTKYYTGPLSCNMVKNCRVL
jgi:hypothetical protein